MDFIIQIIAPILTAFFSGLAGYLMYKVKKREEIKENNADKHLAELLKRDAAINDALRALCRDRILQGYRYYKTNGGITAQDLETMTILYNAYHNLSGNGTITAIYEKILALPIKAGV